MEKLNQMLKAAMPDVVGSLSLVTFNNVVTVKGQLSSEEDALEILKEALTELYPGYLQSIDVEVNQGLTLVSSAGSHTEKERDNKIDEVDVVYMGMLDIKLIKENDKHKIPNDNIRHTMTNVFNVLEFVAPIVLDSNLKVIDGNLRVEIAKELGMTQLPVIVINDDGIRAEFLRLALNRSSEFQRWMYEDVDNFVDSIPQAQPLLEPLGFFGQKVLPESFFANTVIQYRIDPFSEQQKAYQQDEGLAEWARVKRQEIKEAAERAAAQKPKKKNENTVSLFDLVPKEEDFLETYDIDKEVYLHEEKMKEVAGVITDNYDEKRRKEMEARGQSWQGTRRSSKQVAADNRREFIEAINKHDELSEEERNRVIEQLDDIVDVDELEALIEGVKNNE